MATSWNGCHIGDLQANGCMGGWAITERAINYLSNEIWLSSLLLGSMAVAGASGAQGSAIQTAITLLQMECLRIEVSICSSCITP